MYQNLIRSCHLIRRKTYNSIHLNLKYAWEIVVWKTYYFFLCLSLTTRFCRFVSVLRGCTAHSLKISISCHAWIHILTSGKSCQMSLKLFLSFSAGDIISASDTQEVCDCYDVLSCCFYILHAQGVLWGSCRRKGNARGINVLAASYRTNNPTFPLLFRRETARKKIKNHGTDLSTCGT